ELRLVGGGHCAGRVEVKHEGEWGSVCVYDFDWDAQWAGVVCRQLGCGSVAKASPYAPFGQGTGRIWLQPFFCLGHEQKLEDCPHFGWGRHFCGHEWDVGVTCADAVELRLAAGGGPCAGRVEVKLRGQWGTVADEKWDMEEAEVVCRQLGCGSAGAAFPARARFSEVDSPINLALVDCAGDEAALWDCEIRGWGPYNITHGFDTAVICQGLARLVGGEGTCTGRLEVWRDRAWTGVCQDHVDVKVGRVVCRELGCGMALAVGRVEGGMGPLWEGGFECNGTEPFLSACTPRLPHGQGCSGYASIVCSPYTSFRLAGSSSGCTGRVEVEVEGTWASLCAAGWDLPDAHVLCRHLGCGPAAAVPPGGSFGGGNGQLRRDAFGCSGGERHPAECPVVAGLGEAACPPGYTAAVNCSGGWPSSALVSVPGRAWEGVTSPPEQPPDPDPTLCPPGSRRVRLVGSPRRCAGRVEVYSYGTWGTVCQDGWDVPDVTVVCRQLGCGTALEAPGSDRFGPGTGPLWPGASGCTGTEASLWDCPSLAHGDCQRGGGAAAVCSGHLSLRLAGDADGCSGHLEVFHNGTWGRVCADGTSYATATVACRHLGCGDWGRLMAPLSGPPTPAWLAWVDCEEGSRSLWQCPSAPW
ncbi:C163A protein, partial [Trogon melanurus]|nr:C163A protein [Trogon melanurus]